MANRVIRYVVTTFWIQLGSLPRKRSRGSLRLEGRCCSQICAAATLAGAKVEAQVDGGVRTMPEGRDTTSDMAWHVQVHPSHVNTSSGRVSVVNDGLLIHYAETQQARSTMVGLSQRSVKPEKDVDSKISHSANNEIASNVSASASHASVTVRILTTHDLENASERSCSACVGKNGCWSVPKVPLSSGCIAIFVGPPYMPSVMLSKRCLMNSSVIGAAAKVWREIKLCRFICRALAKDSMKSLKQLWEGRGRRLLDSSRCGSVELLAVE